MACAAGGYDCTGQCTFIRGDADCDGAITYNDVYAIQSGNYANADAADVNDDGTVSGSDSTRLSYWLTYGHAMFAPNCPFPGAGRDCTADNLENCCSPPLGNTSQVSNHNCEVTLLPGTWDNDDEDWDDTLSGCAGVGSVDNNSLCNHDNSETSMGVSMDITDPVGFTKKRLVWDIQTATITIIAVINFNPGSACQQYGCAGTNYMFANFDSLKVTVWAGPTAGGSPSSIVLQDISGQENFAYSRTTAFGSCILWWTTPDQAVWDSGPIPITLPLAGMPQDNCQDWEIVGVDIEDAYMSFQRGLSADIATTEQMDITIWPEVSYGWCTCP